MRSIAEGIGMTGSHVTTAAEKILNTSGVKQNKK